MWRVTLRNLLGHKLRLALSALSIVLGVAFVTGTLVFTDTLSRTFDALFASSPADVEVRPATAFDQGLTDGAGATATVPQSVVARIAEVDGVAAVEGEVSAEGVHVVGPDGRVVGTGGAPGMGMGWYREPSLNPASLVEGRAPRSRDEAGVDEVAIDQATVDRAGYAVGDAVPLLTPGPRVEARLVGVLRFGESGGLAGASLVAFDADRAQELLTAPGEHSAVSVAAGPRVGDEELRDRVARIVGSGYEVRTTEEVAAEESAALAEGLRFVSVFLLVFAGVALFVGSFIILNTFSMLMAQRVRELALLRALGAARAQVTRSVLLESLVLGLVGATAGLLGGVGVAAALRALFGRVGLTLDGALVLDAGTVVWAYVVGVLVTLLSAYLPARRAARTSPVAAMQDGLLTQDRPLRRRTLLGGAVTAAGAGLVVGGVTTEDGGRAAALVGAGALLLVLGAIALSPVLAGPFLSTVGAVLPRTWGRTGHLARENARRNPRRTAATASALMVGLALVSAFSVLGASTSASLAGLIDRSLGADYVVSTAIGQPFTPEVGDRISAVPGVGAVLPQRFGAAQVDGAPISLTAVEPGALDATLRLDYVDGSTAGLPGGGLLVDRSTSEGRGWPVGERVELLLPNGELLVLRVGGVFEPNPAVGSAVVPLSAYERAGGPALDSFVYVALEDDADAAEVRAALEEVVAAYPIVTLKDQGEFADEQKGQVDQLLLLVNALLVLSVLIAVLGIVNTLALSVVERTREIGLLRALGMSRRQLRRMVRLESVAISVYGATLGLVLGTALGVGLVQALSGLGIEVLAVPVGRLLVLPAVAAVIGVLAAVWPARRAARLDVMEAIAAA